jgi:uncharacterized protein
MTRARISLFLLATACCLAWLLAAMPVLAQQPRSIPPLVSPVIDLTGTLSAADIERLRRQALALQQDSGGQMQIVMLSTTAPESIEDYAQRAFDTWALGRSGIDDGLLVLVAKDDREVRIHTGRGLEPVITDAIAARLIREYLVPKFRRGDYVGGLEDATLVLASLIGGAPLPAPMAAQSDKASTARVVFALLASIVVALAVRVLAPAFPVALRVASAGLLAAIFGIALSIWPIALLATAIGIVVAAMPLPALERFATALHSGRYRIGQSRPDDFNDAPGSRRQQGRDQGDDDGGGWSGGGGRSGGGGASGGW